jgi:hypothetical protein
MEERPKFNSALKPDYMARGPRIFISGSLDLDLVDSGPDDLDAFAALDPDDRKIQYYESKNVLGMLYRAIDDRKFLRSIEAKSRAKNKQGNPTTSGLLKLALDKVLHKARHIKWRHHLQKAQEIRNIYESIVDDTRYEFAFRQTKPLNELEVVCGIILGASTRIVQQTTREMKEKVQRDFAYIMDLINGSDGAPGSPGDGHSLPRSIACFAQAVERPSHVKSDAALISWKYFAASVCLRELSSARLLEDVPIIAFSGLVIGPQFS